MKHISASETVKIGIQAAFTKRLCLFAAFSAGLVSFGLTDVYWVGSASGDWGTASNWSSGEVPGSAGLRVLITNATPVSIEIGNNKRTIGSISFSGANHTITAPSTSGYLCFGKESEGADDPVIDVAQDITATIPSVRALVASGCGIVKTGEGTLDVTGCFGNWGTFSSFELAAGVFRHRNSTANTFTIGGLCTVRSGARFVAMINNVVADGQVFYLEENAIFDNNNYRDGLGGFTGYGVVTNLSSTSSYWNGGPLDFAGRVYGFITLAPNASYVAGDEGYLRVGASDTLAKAKVEINPGGTYTNVLRFAPGIGSFNVSELVFTKQLPVVLEDTDGEPITLTAGFATDYKNAVFAGRGNFVKSNSNTWIITNDVYAATGMLGVKSGTIEAGTGAEGSDATLDSNISRLDVGAGSTFKMKNYANTTWNLPITGAGTVSPAGTGVWTLNNLSLTNGTLSVVAPATNLVLAGGVSTNMSYSIYPTTFKTTITGGDYAFSSIFNVSADRTVEQTGGSVRCCLQANNTSCSNDIFYTISGGSLVSHASAAVGQYPQGVGMDISGDAHVELRNQANWPHRLESGKASHTIRLFGNAYLGIDDLLIIGEYTSSGTAVMDLQGGVLEVKGIFSQPSGGTITSAEGRILFNGGVLRAVNVNNQSWWSGANDPDERVKAYVGAAGAIIDVKAEVPSRTLAVNWPFVSNVPGGVDGGLVKLGLGLLNLTKPYAATGFIDVREGGLQASTSSSPTQFGTVGARIGCGHLKFAGSNPVSVSAASGASLSYTNCATLALSSGTALTIGDAGAAADSALVREGHGVLLVMSGTANSALGANASVTVNGGLSNDFKTGILRQPIFERRQVTGSDNLYRARFLKCDANNSLVPASPVTFNPGSSTSETVAEITSSAVTVNDNASVGALVVELSPKGAGLTVSSGVTLAVGSGNAGSVAPILLNNVKVSASAGDQTGISGSGTIDFGASEGVIVVNGNAGLQNPIQIDTALAGSGGITFAAPTLFGAGYRGYVTLTKAGSYTGGTWIENVHVSARAGGCFGTGTIHVLGSGSEGGALEIAPTYNSNTFANPIVLAGNGPVYPADNNMPGYFGALIVRKGGVTLSGGMTLAADAKIASGSHSGQKPIEFSAPITGQGGLTVSGTSPFRFAAANTYAGGTVITNGTVEVTDAGTLGSGPVKICAGGVLRFVNASAKTIANVITGDGRIEMNGAAVALTAARGFAGDISGNVSASGDDGYVKSGEGTVAFTNALSYTGATIVSAGTLRLGQTPLGVPAASESIAFHLDASAGDTITEAEGAVVAWTDADGRGIAFTNTAANGPSRTAGALNEKAVLNFDGEIKRRLIANAATPELRTVFFVNRVATTHPYNSWSNMGILGSLNNDYGLRFLNKDNIKADSMFLDGVIHVNGDSSMTAYAQYDTMAVPNNTFVVTEAEVAIPAQNIVFAVGDYWGHNSNKRAYSGDIAEVIAYDRWLTDEERVATERYLQNKWALKEVAANGVFTNMLPVATALTVAEGATLDLAGGYQEVASLSGAGTVANSSTAQATLVLSSGRSEFAGSFSGDIYLEVAADATLDLCGGTLTVAGVGGSGRICNGTLVVTGEIQPGGRGAVGTLTFETAPVVAGATLVVEGAGTAVDALVVEESFNMTGLSLSVPQYRSVPYGKHAVIVADGSLTGEFSATDLPSGRRCSIDYTANTAVLSRKSGMFFTIR